MPELVQQQQAEEERGRGERHREVRTAPQLDEVLALDLPARQRLPSSLELTPRKLLRLLWRYGFGQRHHSAWGDGTGYRRWNELGSRRLERRNPCRNVRRPADADDGQSG